MLTFFSNFFHEEFINICYDTTVKKKEGHYKMLKIMSAGPTQVRENVRQARAIPTTNPDLDASFFEFYEQTTNKLKQLLHTKEDIHILSGEGILGLEAAVASLTQPSDRVLVIENGIFGEGFADFIRLYQGEPVFFHGDRTQGIDLAQLSAFLKEDHDFVYATLVHVDTPSGVCNDIQAICTLLDSYGIASVVDSVAGMFALPVDIDSSHIDILCGGSQKALSVPPGLTMLSISKRAWNMMEHRRVGIAGFYVNLLNFKSVLQDRWFPYTMPISDIYGLAQGIDNVLQDPQIIERHEHIAKATRLALQQAGFSLYLTKDHASTVTVICTPQGVDTTQLLQDMQTKHQILISGCFGYLKNLVIRIGHMGENCNIEDVALTLEALQGCMKQQGFLCNCDLKQAFLQSL